MFAATSRKAVIAVNFGPGQTGKTVGYTLLNGDGSTFQTRTTIGVAEVQTGSGIYKVELGASVFTSAFDGYVVWDVAGSAPFAAEEILIDADIAAIRAHTDLITSTGIINLVAPVTSSGSIELIHGDDYLAADNRALQWASATFPTLTGATIQLQVRAATKTSPSSFNGTVLNSTTAEVELTAAQTLSLTAGTYTYALKATLTDTHTVTLATGPLVVQNQP